MNARILEYFEKHPNQCLDLKSVAKELNMPVNKLINKIDFLRDTHSNLHLCRGRTGFTGCLSGCS